MIFCHQCQKEISIDLDWHMFKEHPGQWLKKLDSACEKSVQKMECCKNAGGDDDELDESFRFVYQGWKDDNALLTERIKLSTNSGDRDTLHQAMFRAQERIGLWSVRKKKLAQRLNIKNTGSSFYLSLHLIVRNEEGMLVRRCFSTSARIAYGDDAQHFHQYMVDDLMEQINSSRKNGWVISTLCELDLHVF